MIQSQPLDENTLMRISEWEQAHLATLLPPVALFIAVGFWIAWDAGRLLAGKFTDAEGKKITKWI